MQAIRAAHAFDGTQFLPGGATLLVDGDRIAGVHTGRLDLPEGVEVTEYDGTVLPGADPEEHSAPWNQQGLGNSRLHQMSVGISGLSSSLRRMFRE